jgi:hypothetical protein
VRAPAGTKATLAPDPAASFLLANLEARPGVGSSDRRDQPRGALVSPRKEEPVLAGFQLTATAPLECMKEPGFDPSVV